jgi:hypothetical protein
MQLVIFLSIFNAPCMCPKIDVMKRECKNLEFEEYLNKALYIVDALIHHLSIYS